MNLFKSVKYKLIDFFEKRFTQKHHFVGNPNLLDEDYKIITHEASSNITDNLIKFAYLEDDELFKTLDSNLIGLNSEQVILKRQIYGLNQVEQEKKLPWYYRLWLCYKNPFNLLLTILAIISYLTDDIPGASIIGVMVLISTVLRFIQELRSNNAADKLKEMVSTTVAVFRKKKDKAEELEDKGQNKVTTFGVFPFNNSLELPIKELVPGDIIALSAGDMIPADVKIITSKDLFVSQAALTGESLPIEKFSTNNNKNIKNPLELENIGFMGTNVVSGTATAIVLTTGKNTLFGSLANKVIHQEFRENSFQKGVHKVSWLLIYFMLVMAPIVFFINGFTKHDWMSSALLALSIAVGLTPEMLPMIVTSTLAKGAVAMSRRKVIVKRLDAIQNFGAMDVLCTDKTGTLTQDKICLEKHTNIFGEEYDDVLEYAYLNSYYQTGLKNLLDIAVLEQANYGDIPNLIKKFNKVDEVPFDFNRRRMSVVVAKEDQLEHILICKGAVEEMLNVCGNASYGEEVLPLTPELLRRLRAVTSELNEDGLRVVAVAVKSYKSFKETYTVSDEKDMTLVGYIAFLDPPKETTRGALEALKCHGVAVKILTGDNEKVTAKVCREVGLSMQGLLLGSQIDDLTDEELGRIAEDVTVFAKLTPAHKERIVEILHARGHVVGFMGDGINDAPALRAADIGISVDTAVDIAKEAADIILLEKSLMVLEKGIEEGRKTFANMLKYIKITASSNFGNVFSMLVASAFLPFQPMLPIQVLVLGLIYDISQIAIPFDNVDKEFIDKPQRWDPLDLRRFMVFFGPLSSIFDIATFFLMWHFYGANSQEKSILFQSGWFIESLFTQMLIVHMIRTRKIPFIQSVASMPMVFTMLIMLFVGALCTIMPALSSSMKLQALPLSYFGWLILIVAGYMLLVQSMKGIYARKFNWQ